MTVTLRSVSLFSSGFASSCLSSSREMSPKSTSPYVERLEGLPSKSLGIMVQRHRPGR